MAAQRPSLTSARFRRGHPCFPVSLVLQGLIFFWLLPGRADRAGDLLWVRRKAWGMQISDSKGDTEASQDAGEWLTAVTWRIRSATGYDNEVNLTDGLVTRFQAKEKKKWYI